MMLCKGQWAYSRKIQMQTPLENNQLYLVQTNKYYLPFFRIVFLIQRNKQLQSIPLRKLQLLPDFCNSRWVVLVLPRTFSLGDQIVCPYIQHGAESKMMFSDSEEEDIKKFSFLLGSSLRNEDEEQFLTLYDAAIPANTTKAKVDCIKEKARQIAELPDDQYHELVLKAREFSLAPSTKMHHGSEKSQRKSSWSQNSDGDEDECIPSENSSALSSYSLRSAEKSGNKTYGSDDLGYHSSSKAVPSLGNLSDHDTSDSESRGGFDYYPKSKSVDRKKYVTNDGDSSPSSNFDARDGIYFDYYPVIDHYDEAHDVESNQSSQDINSPRSDISLGKNNASDIQDLEMTTFREEHIENVQNDFFTDEDSDSEKKTIHQRLYHRPGTYTPMSHESSEDYASGFTGKLSFAKSEEVWKGRSTSSLRGSKCVDDAVMFSSLSSDKYSRYGSCSTGTPGSNTSSRQSGKVTIETTSFPKETDTLLGKKTPFWDGQMKNSGTSVNEIMGRKDSTKNKPGSKPVSKGVNATLDEDKKKDKDEKDNGEEKTTDKSRKDIITDENGNPVVSTNYFNRQAYRQMREQPKSSHAVISTSKNQYSYGTTSSSTDVFHRDFHLEQYLPSHQIDSEDGSNSLYDKRKLRKKKHKEKIVHSEDVDNYVGNKDIDELVNFIENDGIRKKKKLLSASLSNEHSTKTEKSNKKTKEKKLKCSDPSEFLAENSEIIEDHSKDINTFVESEESKEAIESLELSMGNSLGKVDENTEQCEVQEKSVENVLKNGADRVEKISLIKNEEMKNPKQRNGKKETISQVTESVKRKSSSDVEKKVKITKESENAIKKSNAGKCKESGDILNNKKEFSNNKICSPVMEYTDTIDDSVKNHELKSENKHKEVQLVEVKMQELKTENNIKRHNAKNSKTEKDFMTHIPNDIAKPCSSKGDDSDISTEEVSPYYIFTDVDRLPPVEHEFTLVSKKKKHVPISKKQVVSTCTTPRELPVIAKPVHPREKLVTPVRSVTPPPYSSNFITNNEETRLRDLSPSAFPALRSNSKGRQPGHDGRRNSTGDVPSESSLKLQDDSDIESVKSLPVSQAGNNDPSQASNMPVTYAKVAASPKQKDALQTNSKTIVIPSSPSEQDNAQPSLWKGNATERRHSIGSSPEDVHISSLQKGISQEVLLPEVQVSTSKTSSDAVKNKVQRNLSNDYLSESPLIEKVGGDTGSSEKSEIIEPKNHIVGSNIADRDNSNALPQRVKSSRISRKERTKSPHSKTQNNCKKLKMQSVIFLDKRVESIPQNFGISFGFDDSAELQHDENVINVNPNPNSHKMVKPERLTANSSVNTNKMGITNSPASSIPSAISTVNSENVESKNVSTVISSNQLLSGNSSIKNIHLTKDGTSKKQQAIPGMNGIIQPNLHDRPKLTHYRTKPIVDKTQTLNNYATKEKLSHKELDNNNDGKKVPPSSVVVEYGTVEWPLLYKDTSCTKIPSNGPKKTCKTIGFIPELAKNDDRFNICDALGFLQREWDKVADIKERDPSKVVVYSEQ